ncbi:MAG: response regulator transcription factor [Oscillospiraceae bacterium]|nr:response regulator transcription factor [Oscillospiraceae bacterium]
MIYLLEDDANIRKFVLYALNSVQLEAKGFELPSEFWAAMDEEMPDLLLLDIMLPEEDGLSILKKLRSASATSSLPVIMLTAKDTEYDKVMGLDSGADDYVAKPFGTMELVSRIKALLRRTEKKDNTEEYTVGELYVCPSKHIVRAGQEQVSLALKEFELLCELLKHKGNVCSRDMLFDSVWGYSFDVGNRTLDVHIRSLRSKLGKCGELIETVRGMGYKIGDGK